MQSFFEFLVSVISHCHINALHLSLNRFEWFCFQINSDAKYVLLFWPKICDQGLILVIVYCFQIGNEKERNFIISWVISRYMGPIYIETPYTYSRGRSGYSNLKTPVSRKRWFTRDVRQQQNVVDTPWENFRYE